MLALHTRRLCGDETIVSANVAVETALNSFLYRLLGKNASNGMMKKIQWINLSTRYCYEIAFRGDWMG